MVAGVLQSPFPSLYDKVHTVLRLANKLAYTYDLDTRRMTNLTDDIFSDADPSWAADGSAIYFSVDFDATSGEIAGNVVPYFNGVTRAFDEESAGAPEYRVGAYGSGLVCGTLTSKGLIVAR